MDKKYLELKPEDLAKVNRSRAGKDTVKIDGEQLFIAEFGKHYGWGGVMAILNNEIDSQTASWLLMAARKIDSRYSYDNARTALIGAGAAQAKKPSQVFKKATSDILKDSQADL